MFTLAWRIALYNGSCNIEPLLGRRQQTGPQKLPK